MKHASDVEASAYTTEGQASSLEATVPNVMPVPSDKQIDVILDTEVPVAEDDIDQERDRAL